MKRIEFPEGVYNGETAFMSKVRNGRGEMVYKNGERYVGNWVNDKREGQGLLVFQDGGRYQGTFHEDRMEGQGVVTNSEGMLVYEGGMRNGERDGWGKAYGSDGILHYEGGFREGKKHGTGKFYASDGSRYEGGYKEDQLDGKGIFYYPNGVVYDGDFAEGWQTGRAKMTWPDGDVYEGDFIEGERTGKGVYFFRDGDRYAGDFVNGRLEGKGIFTWADGDRYQGDFVNDGERTGTGKMYFSDGDYYEGGFLRGAFNGEGTYHFSDGGYYQGSYKNNLRDGQGTLNYGDGTDFTGIFKNNEVWSGNGTVQFSDGDIYTGALKNGQMHGSGILVMENGDRYEGEFVRGKMQGKGKYTWADGEYYEGEYVNDLQEGYGRLVCSDDSCYEGEFYEELRHGRGKITYSDGSSFEGEFREGNVLNGYGKVEYTDGSCWIGRIKEGFRDGKGIYRDAAGNTFEGEYTGGFLNGKATVTRPDGVIETGLYIEDEKVSDDVDILLPQEDKSSCGNPVIDSYFEGMIGMSEVRKNMVSIYNRLKLEEARSSQTLSDPGRKPGYHFVLTGNPGTGKTTVARIIGKMLVDMGILQKEEIVEVTRERLVSNYIGQTAQQTRQAIEEARGGVLFIDEAYTLYKKGVSNDFGIEAIETILKDMSDHQGEYSVILAGYEDRIDEMIRNANPGLASRFNIRIKLPDYSTEDLVDVIVKSAKQENYFIRPAAKGRMMKAIEKQRVDENFGNARTALKIYDDAKNRMADRLAAMETEPTVMQLQLMLPDDFGSLDDSTEDLQVCLDRLNSLIGLGKVKEEINEIVSSAKFQIEARRRGLASPNEYIPLNFVFTGNAGTGKTTVARLIGKIYYHLGLLKRDDVFIECSRGDLVGQYEGQTAQRVREKVHEALGGVLFIDEAYALVNGDNDSFGLEAVAELNREIGNNLDKLAVIMAGYTRDMEKFLDSNQGLRRRLPNIIEFEDYSTSELCEIFSFEASRRHYTLRCSPEKIRDLIELESRRKDFGNAGGVGNILNAVVKRQKKRVMMNLSAEMSNEEFMTITDEDLY